MDEHSKRFVPAEWAAHKAIWTCFPSNPDLWFDHFAQAQEESAAMIRVLSEGDVVKVLVCSDMAMARAQNLLGGCANIDIIAAKFGDIWLRDTGPIFTNDGSALRFKTNGWGGKYIYEYDDIVGDQVADLAEKPVLRQNFILEGGAVDQDGDGTLLTTAQCLLNPNRNTGWSRKDAEENLCAAFGASKVIWVDEGLLNDHTDGHIDNIARFVGVGKVVCMSPYGDDDPNTEILNRIIETLESAQTARGEKMRVIKIPSPGRVENEEGDVIPASHMNFIIGNKTVVVPTYGTASADQAVSILQDVFPDRKVIGLPSNAILTGGGSFHCITQQEPA